MKVIEFTKPLLSLSGQYQQIMAVLTYSGNLIAHFPGSTVPNYKIPDQPDKPNLEEYPVICGGQYRGVYSETGHKDSVPAIVFEDNGLIPIYQSANPRYPGHGKYATHIHIHEGYTDSWRGSAGCPTLAKGGSKFLTTLFTEGDEVLIIIPDPFWFVFEGR